MYCRLCDIEYPKSLRFCKWCGGGLVVRESVGNQHCPSCGSGIEREWVFCNECGVDLATLGAQPRDVVCPACSATVRKGWMFCRQCGEQIATERAAEKCASCGAGTRANWRYCKQCGEGIAGAPPPRGPSGFRTIAGIPALPPEELEDAPFTGLRSGELPPLEDVMKHQQRQSPKVTPPPQVDAGHAGGTASLADRRSTGQLEPDAIEHELRSQKGADAAAPAQFGRLEASELIESRPLASQGGQPAPGGAPPSSDATVAVESPFAPGAASPHQDVTVAVPSPFAQPSSPSDSSPFGGASNQPTMAGLPSPFYEPQPPAPEPNTPPQIESTQVMSAPVIPQMPSYDTPETGYPQTGAGHPAYVPTPPHPFPAPPSAPSSFPPPAPQPGPGPQWAPQQPQSPGAPSQPIGAPLGSQPLGAPQASSQSFASSAPSQPFAPPAQTSPLPQAQTSFPAPTASASGSSTKWAVVAVVLLLVLGGCTVGAYFAYQWWAARQVAATPEPGPTPAPAPAPPAPAPAPPAPTGPAGMVAVPGGSFDLGSDDPNADVYSKPAHRVEVKPFYIDATEVTNAQYKAFVDATGRDAPRGWENGAPKAGTEQLPVVYVTWDEARAYAAWAGKRLPTEAEWEFAARGTDGRAFPWGPTFDGTKGNLGKAANAAPVAVGSYPDGKSPFGALDMVGNVWEWTSSDFSIYPGGTADPPPGKNYKIIRGGAFDNVGDNSAYYRGFQPAGQRFPKVGFRCAKDQP